MLTCLKLIFLKANEKILPSPAKKMPPPYAQFLITGLVPLFPLSANIDLIRLTPQHKQPCVSKIRDIRRGLSKISSRICNAMIEHRIAYRTYWISTNEHRDAIPQEILQSRLFLTSRNFETHGCQWYGVKQIKCFFADKGNCGPMFRATLYYLKFSFFYKIDFEHSEQCLFQVVRLMKQQQKH